MDAASVIALILTVLGIATLFMYIKTEIARLQQLIDKPEQKPDKEHNQVDLTRFYPIRYDIPIDAMEFLAKLSMLPNFSIGTESFVAYYRDEPYSVIRVDYDSSENYVAFPLREGNSFFLYVMVFASPKVCDITCPIDFIQGIKQAIEAATRANLRYDFDGSKWKASIHHYDVRGNHTIQDWYTFSDSQPRETVLNKLSSFVYVTTLEAARALRSLPSKVNYVVVDSPSKEVDSVLATCKGVLPNARLIVITDKLKPDAVPSRRQSVHTP